MTRFLVRPFRALKHQTLLKVGLVIVSSFIAMAVLCGTPKAGGELYLYRVKQKEEAQ